MMLIDFDPPRGGNRERICRPRQPGSDSYRAWHIKATAC